MRLFALTVIALAGTALAPTVARAGGVAVVQSDDLDPYTAPVVAFEEALGQPVTTYNLYGREKDAEALADRFEADPPDVVFALGAKAAWIVKKRTPDIPLVYASILSPGRFDIEGRNTAGVLMIASPERSVSQIAGFFPEVRTICVLRGPSIPDARIEAMTAAAEAVGVTLMVERVRSPKDLRGTLDRLSTRVDGLWLQADRQVLDRPTYKYVVEETQRTRLPLIVETENMVRAGGMFAVVPDPGGVGQKAASLVQRVLDGGSLEGERVYADDVDLVLHLGRVRAAETGFQDLLLDFVDVVVQ